ncbi:MAG TPA: hypothetical protein VGM79_15780 [Streptosporangiaceae bacterium]
MRRRRVGTQQPDGQVALEADRRQALAEQVAQVAADAQALTGEGLLGQLRPG